VVSLELGLRIRGIMTVDRTEVGGIQKKKSRPRGI
jgi:hypothetical protein